jgi:hypothetical protein
VTPVLTPDALTRETGSRCKQRIKDHNAARCGASFAMHKTTKTASADKPQKPRPDFPLFPHRTNRWAKKIRGRFVYFGKVSDDPNGETALNLWLEQKDCLLAGRTPRTSRQGLTVRELCNRFLTVKQGQVDTRVAIPRFIGAQETETALE